MLPLLSRILSGGQKRWAAGVMENRRAYKFLQILAIPYWGWPELHSSVHASVGTLNIEPNPNASRRETGTGEAPNSNPRAWHLPFQGGAAIARFSSQTATHGKSRRLKQYPIKRRSRMFVAATNPISRRGSNKAEATKPKPGFNNTLVKSTFLPSGVGAAGHRNS